MKTPSRQPIDLRKRSPRARFSMPGTASLFVRAASRIVHAEFVRCFFVLSALALFFMAAVDAEQGPHPPIVTAVSPINAPAAFSFITLMGSNFAGQDPDTGKTAAATPLPLKCLTFRCAYAADNTMTSAGTVTAQSRINGAMGAGSYRRVCSDTSAEGLGCEPIDHSLFTWNNAWNSGRRCKEQPVTMHYGEEGSSAYCPGDAQYFYGLPGDNINPVNGHEGNTLNPNEPSYSARWRPRLVCTPSDGSPQNQEGWSSNCGCKARICRTGDDSSCLYAQSCTVMSPFRIRLSLLNMQGGSSMSIKLTVDSNIALGAASELSQMFSYDAPVIANLRPSIVSRYSHTLVSVFGSKFGAPGSPCTVSAQYAQISSACSVIHDGLARVVVEPGGGTDLEFSLNVNGQRSSVRGMFDYDDRPDTLVIFPSIGVVSGTTITISARYGYKFGALAAVAGTPVTCDCCRYSVYPSYPCTCNEPWCGCRVNCGVFSETAPAYTSAGPYLMTVSAQYSNSVSNYVVSVTWVNDNTLTFSAPSCSSNAGCVGSFSFMSTLCSGSCTLGRAAGFNYFRGGVFRTFLYANNISWAGVDAIEPGTVQLLAGTGSNTYKDGCNQVVSFSAPQFLALSVDGGTLFTFDASKQLRAIDIMSGNSRAIAGALLSASASDGAPGAFGCVSKAIQWVGDDRIILALDACSHALRIVAFAATETSSSSISTAIGLLNSPGYLDGNANSARMNSAEGLCMSKDGSSAYVVDTGNHCIRHIPNVDAALGDSPGYKWSIYTLAGTNVAGFANGQSSVARFNSPKDCVVHKDFVYVTDFANHAIRAVHAKTGYVYTLAGSGSAGNSNGRGSAASFNQPVGIDVLPSGWLVVGTQNEHRVRVVDTATGDAASFGPPGGSSGNTNTPSGSPFDSASNVRMSSPKGIAAARDGSFVYVADSGNHAVKKMFVQHSGVSCSPQSLLAMTASAHELVSTKDSDNAVSNGLFGHSIDCNGDVEVLGAPGENSGAGRVYISTRISNTWTLARTLTSSGSGTSGNDQCGFSVAVHRNFAIVGCPYDGSGDTGDAIIMLRNSGGLNAWGTVFTLATSPGVSLPSTSWGHSVAISGSWAVVGAPYYSTSAQCYNDYARYSGSYGGWSTWEIGAVYFIRHKGDGTWIHSQLVPSPYSVENNYCFPYWRFGFAVALHNGIAAIARTRYFHSSYHGNQLGVNRGEVLLYELQSSTWVYITTTHADSVAVDHAYCGSAVALDAEVLLFGCPGDGANGAAPNGRASIWENLRGTWQKIATLSPSSASGGDRFGSAVALHGGVAAVSSRQYSDGSNSGIVYVFSRNACSSWASSAGRICNSQWGLVHTLTASGASNFGASVAMDGPFFHASSVSQSSNAGRVFRYRRKILASRSNFATAASGSSTMHQAINSVSAAFRSNTNFAQMRQAHPSFYSDTASHLYRDQLLEDGTQTGSSFGRSLSTEADWALIGAPFAARSSLGGAGRVYVFRKNLLLEWTKLGELSPQSPDASANAHFGSAVSIFTNIRDCNGGAAYASTCPLISSRSTLVAVVGAPLATNGGLYEAGVVYVYEAIKSRSSTLLYKTTLKAVDAANYANFGFSVAGSGHFIVVGAPNNNLLPTAGSIGSTGAVYVFTRNSIGKWMHLQKLTPSASMTPFCCSSFGFSVAVVDDTVAVGAPGLSSVSGRGRPDPDCIHGPRTGGVFVFRAEMKHYFPLAAAYFPSTRSLQSEPSIRATDRLMSGFSSTIPATVLPRSSYFLLQRVISPSDGASDDRFGHSLSLSKDKYVLAVGSPGHDLNSASGAGAVYVYHRQSPLEQWRCSNISRSRLHFVLAAKVVSPVPAAGQHAGFSVAVGGLNNSYVALGVPGYTACGSSSSSGETALAENAGTGNF
jgi:hypothetical protein